MIEFCYDSSLNAILFLGLLFLSLMTHPFLLIV